MYILKLIWRKESPKFFKANQMQTSCGKVLPFAEIKLSLSGQRETHHFEICLTNFRIVGNFSSSIYAYE